MGAFVITLTNRLPSALFRVHPTCTAPVLHGRLTLAIDQVLEYQMYEMSWGAATVYIQQKIIDDDDFDGTNETGDPDEEDPDL